MSLLSTFAILFETDAKKATKETKDLVDALEGVEKSASDATDGVDSATKSYKENSSSAGALTKGIEDLSNAMDDVEEATKSIVDGVNGATEAYNDSSASAGLLEKESEGLSVALDDVEKSSEGAADGVGVFAIMGGKAGDMASKTAKDLTKMAAAYFTIKAAVDGIIGNALGIDTIGKFSQTLGFNIEQLDAWGAATKRNGGSAEAFRGTVESLQGSLQDISITGGGEIINTLAMIGVQATDSGGRIKSAFEILPEIAEAFKGMSTEQSFAFGRRLGLDQGTILTLQQSRFEIDKLVERQKQLSGVTKEGYEAAALFNDQWADTKTAFNALWMGANSTILPLFQSILKGLESTAVWVRDNSSFVEGFFIGLTAVLIDVAFVTGAIAAPALLAVGSFLLVGAAIVGVGVAVAFLYEDVKAWVNGSKSAIGELLGTFEDFKSKITGIFDSLGEKWDSFVNKVKNIGNIFDFSGDFEASIIGPDGLKTSAGGSGEIVTGPGSELGPEVMQSNNAAAMETINSYSATNLNHGGSTVNQRTQTNNVTVGGSTIDARGMTGSEAKSAINSSMNESVTMALGQLADGIER